jgi:hypothetical protein
MTAFAGDPAHSSRSRVLCSCSSLRSMSEYWVSKKRYFCKYCDTYIADDVPSRQHHENGLRHKGNVERFVRGLYKAGEKRKKDADEEKREMRRIEQVRSSTFFIIFVSLSHFKGCQYSVRPRRRGGSSPTHSHSECPLSRVCILKPEA